jgi:FixJ family two-component response regulator
MTSPRVAIVDDDPSVRRGLARLLRSAGHHPVSYASAADFLKAGLSAGPACVILDIHLGGMSGLELLAQLRAAGNALPVILITAHDDPGSRDEGRRLGCAAYLPKPFEAAALLQEIHDAMGSQV